MVTTVTLNPSLDRTLWVDALRPGELHRVTANREHVSGKGINISLALHAWGHPTRVCGIVAGRTGRRIKEELEQAKIAHDLVSCPGETRTNTKVIERPSGRLTELNEQGPPVAPETAERVLKAVVQGRGKGTFVALAGSLPPGIEPGRYQAMIETLRGGGPVALDASGSALVQGVKGRPDIVKPNVEELEALIGRALPALEDRLRGVRRVHQRGVKMIALSMGPEGAIFSNGQDIVWARSKPIQAKSPVGCGDVLLAGLLFALGRSWAWEACARFAVAAATAAALQEGTAPPPFAEVENALESVTAEQVDGVTIQ